MTNFDAHIKRMLKNFKVELEDEVVEGKTLFNLVITHGGNSWLSATFYSIEELKKVRDLIDSRIVQSEEQHTRNV